MTGAQGMLPPRELWGMGLSGMTGTQGMLPLLELWGMGLSEMTRAQGSHEMLYYLCKQKPHHLYMSPL